MNCFDVTYCTERKEEAGLIFLVMLLSYEDLLLFWVFIGEGEATGVSGEGVCTGGGAYCCQSGGKSVATSVTISCLVQLKTLDIRDAIQAVRASNQPRIGQ